MTVRRLVFVSVSNPTYRQLSSHCPFLRPSDECCRGVRLKLNAISVLCGPYLQAGGPKPAESELLVTFGSVRELLSSVLRKPEEAPMDTFELSGLVSH